MGEKLLRRARLQKVAQMKNADAVGNIFNHREVVGDEEVCKPRLVLDVLHQVDNLRLNGHIERRDTLIGNDQLRVHDKRPGDADTLPLTTGKLMRVPVCMFRRQTYLVEDVCHHLGPLFLGMVPVMDIQPLCNDIRYFLARI